VPLERIIGTAILENVAAKDVSYDNLNI